MASETENNGRWSDHSTTTVTLPLRDGQARQSLLPVRPKSSHLSDDFLRDFLDPAFDPAAFFNAKLPPLLVKQSPKKGGSGALPLAELSAQAQELISQVNSQTTRLSETLTQLADDMMRSGSRLAYEVELLRGETLGLSETIKETLEEEMRVFIPGGLDQEEITNRVAPSPRMDGQSQSGTEADAAVREAVGDQDPECIRQLQMLTLVRSRLDSVIKTFGDAMDFTFPPSELSVGSSFLSVSGPDPESQQQSMEEKGQEVLRKLREEISGLLKGHDGGDDDEAVRGIEQAAARIEALKKLASVWKGTAEEKGRSKVIEGLAKMVEDRHRELMADMERAAKRAGKASSSPAKRAASTTAPPETGDRGPEDARAAMAGGFGLISQLQRLRSGL